MAYCWSVRPRAGSKLTDRAVDAGNGGVKLSALPLLIGDGEPFTGFRVGDDCDGDSGVVAWRAPSGESGVLQRSFAKAETIFLDI